MDPPHILPRFLGTASDLVIVGFLEIQIDLVQGGLVNPCKLLIQLDLHNGRAHTPTQKSAMEAIMELEAGHSSHHDLLHDFPHGVK